MFYVIMKRLNGKTGIISSKHETFEAAQEADEKLQKHIEDSAGPGYGVRTVIIESENLFDEYEKVTPSEY